MTLEEILAANTRTSQCDIQVPRYRQRYGRRHDPHTIAMMIAQGKRLLDADARNSVDIARLVVGVKPGAARLPHVHGATISSTSSSAWPTSIPRTC